MKNNLADSVVLNTREAADTNFSRKDLLGMLRAWSVCCELVRNAANFFVMRFFLRLILLPVLKGKKKI